MIRSWARGRLWLSRAGACRAQVVQLNCVEDEVGLEQYMCSFNTQVGAKGSACASSPLARYVLACRFCSRA